MALSLSSVTFDCERPPQLANFWAAALGYEKRESNEYYASLRHPDGTMQLSFFKVPESKTVKNRVHIDMSATDRNAEVQRLVGLGARPVRVVHEYNVEWTVMEDPEGNEFCIA